MEKNYLPSRQFVIRLVAILGLVILAFVVDKVFVYFRNKPGSALAPTPLAVKDIVQKDSNNNGIADWEETLWGLDPTKDGDANREFINNKRAQLAQNAANDPYSVSQSTPENQALAQEFFAVVMSLQQTGDLDNTALSAIGDTIGKILLHQYYQMYIQKICLLLYRHQQTLTTRMLLLLNTIQHTQNL